MCVRVVSSSAVVHSKLSIGYVELVAGQRLQCDGVAAPRARESSKSGRASEKQECASRGPSATCSIPGQSAAALPSECPRTTRATGCAPATRTTCTLPRRRLLGRPARTATSHSSSARARRKISASGQYVMPLTIGKAPADEHACLMLQRRRHLPRSALAADPGWPERRDETACSGCQRLVQNRPTRASSSRLPTRGDERASSNAGAPSRTRSRRYAATALGLPPFSSSGSTASTSTASARGERRLAEQDLAGLGGLLEAGGDVDGIAGDERVPTLPAITSPVLTPIRAWKPSPATASRSSVAARSARSASSSWSVGIPKTAITASPMNFSTVPPWRSRAVRASSK